MINSKVSETDSRAAKLYWHNVWTVSQIQPQIVSNRDDPFSEDIAVISFIDNNQERWKIKRWHCTFKTGNRWRCSDREFPASMLLTQKNFERANKILGRVRGNMCTSSKARWKARGRLPIRDNWTFFASSYGSHFIRCLLYTSDAADE